MSVLRIDLDDYLLFGWREGCGSTRPLLGVEEKHAVGGELPRCLVPQPEGVTFGGEAEVLNSTPGAESTPFGRFFGSGDKASV